MTTKLKISIDNFEDVKDPIDSPRTLEACLARGIAVRDLYPKSAADFMDDAGFNHERAHILHEFYEGRRQQYIQEVREERTAVIEKLSASHRMRSAGGSGILSKTGASSLTQTHVEALRLASIERERKRSEFAKEKQKADIEDMIKNEVRMAQQAEKQLEEERKARIKEEERKRALAIKRKKAAEEKRKKEIKRKEEADARVVIMRKQAASALFAETKRLKEETVKAEQLDKKRKAEAEALRILQTERDKEKERQLEAEAIALEKRLKEWEIKEQDRAKKLEEFRAQCAAEAEAKALAADKRLEAALTRDAEAMVKKRMDYEKHVVEAVERRKEHEVEEAKNYRARAAARAAKQKKMREAFERARAEEYAWTRKLATDASKHDKVLEDVRTQQHDEMHERAVEHMLHMYQRMERVKRQRRKDEYNRMQNLLKMMEAEKKLLAEEEDKRKAALQRQQHQKRLLMMKHVAETELEGMRVSSNFSGLSKLMEKTLNAGGIAATRAAPADE